MASIELVSKLNKLFTAMNYKLWKFQTKSIFIEQQYLFKGMLI
jgi:hypothetical protein